MVNTANLYCIILYKNYCVILESYTITIEEENGTKDGIHKWWKFSKAAALSGRGVTTLNSNFHFSICYISKLTSVRNCQS